MYEAPKLVEFGTVADVTLDVINKNAGTGDVIVINGQSISVPGGSVINVS
jgi:hypothetical protein